MVRSFWSRVEERDWAAARELLHDDLVCEWPHSGERISGADAFIDLNRHFPEPWAIRLLRVVAEGDQAVTELEATSSGDGREHAASFFTVGGGRISRIREYWVTERYQERPEWRARWTTPL